MFFEVRIRIEMRIIIKLIKALIVEKVIFDTNTEIINNEGLINEQGA